MAPQARSNPVAASAQQTNAAALRTQATNVAAIPKAENLRSNARRLGIAMPVPIS
jgi:hypothetical protein